MGLITTGISSGLRYLGDVQKNQLNKEVAELQSSTNLQTSQDRLIGTIAGATVAGGLGVVGKAIGRSRKSNDSEDDHTPQSGLTGSGVPDTLTRRNSLRNDKILNHSNAESIGEGFPSGKMDTINVPVRDYSKSITKGAKLAEGVVKMVGPGIMTGIPSLVF